jgi:hypothetical protein
MINPLAALDVATKHQRVADQIVESCDDAELCELVLDLLAMYSHAANRMLSDLGWLATVDALVEIRDRSVPTEPSPGNVVQLRPNVTGCSADWAEKHAAELILAEQLMAGSRGVEANLRAFGAAALLDKFHTLDLFGNTIAVARAIPALWRKLLPQLSTRSGQDLLEHFVTQEMTYDND